jgi:predicted secreted protein
MATAIRGCFGKIKTKDLAATGAVVLVGGIQEWSLSEEAEDIDASEIGTCTKASVAGANSRSLSISGFYAPSDGNQSDLTVGNIVTVEIYPAGSGSGNEYFATTTGGATVLSVERGGSNDGLVSLSLSLKINGDLTTTAVP